MEQRQPDSASRTSIGYSLGFFRRQTKRLDCRFIYGCCDLQTMITLVGGQRISGLLAKLAVNFTSVITLVLESFLDVDHYLVGRKIGVGVDRTIVNIAKVGGLVSPGWKPVTTVPIPVATPIGATHKRDIIVMAVPPPAIMPGSVISGEQRVIISPAQSAAPMPGQVVAGRKSITGEMSSGEPGRVTRLQSGSAMRVQAVPRALVGVETMLSVAAGARSMKVISTEVVLGMITRVSAKATTAAAEVSPFGPTSSPASPGMT